MVVWKRVQVGVGRKDGSIVASHENVGRNATQRIKPESLCAILHTIGIRPPEAWNMELWGFGASGSYPHSRLLIEHDPGRRLAFVPREKPTSTFPNHARVERRLVWDDGGAFRAAFCRDETPSGEMERSSPRAVDPAGNTVMQRVKHPPVRNKINLADPAQVRAWTRRLGVSVEVLTAVVDRVGNSVAAVTKEVELQRATRPASPLPPRPNAPAEGELPAPV
jgi:hypothetical protein